MTVSKTFFIGGLLVFGTALSIAAFVFLGAFVPDLAPPPVVIAVALLVAGFAGYLLGKAETGAGRNHVDQRGSTVGGDLVGGDLVRVVEGKRKKSKACKYCGGH